MQIQILLSETDLHGISPQTRDALLVGFQRFLAGLTKISVPDEVMGAFASSAPAGTDQDDIDEREPVDLTVQEARRFLEGCNDKTRQVIRGITAGKSREFRMSDLLKTLGVTIDDISGVWGGLTRRVRTILQNKKTEVKLVVWKENFYDGNNKWMDATGAISEVTYLSFRQVFGIR